VSLVVIFLVQVFETPEAELPVSLGSGIMHNRKSVVGEVFFFYQGTVKLAIVAQSLGAYVIPEYFYIIIPIWPLMLP